MGLRRIVLWLSCAVFAAVDSAFVACPVRLASLVDIDLPTGTARIEFAAMYGGLELGVAAFLAYCASRPERARIGLVASGCAAAGFAITRAGGLLLAGPGRPILWAMLTIELLASGLSFWAALSTSPVHERREA